MCLGSGWLVRAGSIAELVLVAEVRDQLATLEWPDAIGIACFAFSLSGTSAG